MKKLVFEKLINAPVEKVWKRMLDRETYIEWVGASWPGSTYTGKWEQGEKISFAGEDGSGTLAEIRQLRRNELISATHVAILLPGGIEDRTSDLAKNWVGIVEEYHFESKGNATLLTVEITTNPEWEQMFNDGWPAALDKLKEISER